MAPVMEVSVTIKNTLIELKVNDTEKPRGDSRFQTVPSAWRPLEPMEDDSEEEDELKPCVDGENKGVADISSDVSTEVSTLEDSVIAEFLKDYQEQSVVSESPSSRSSSSLHSDLVPQCTPAPLNSTRRMSWASCSPSECGDESDEDLDIAFEFQDSSIINVAEVSNKEAPSAFCPARPQLTVGRKPLTSAAKPFVPAFSVPAVSSEVKLPEKPEAPAATATPKVDDRTSWERFEAVVDQVQKQLMDRKGCVANVRVVEGRNGWAVTAYVKPEQLRFEDLYVGLKELVQQAMVTAVGDVLGYNTLPFTSMPLGFSCTLVVMPGSQDQAEVIVRFQPAP